MLLYTPEGCLPKVNLLIKYGQKCGVQDISPLLCLARDIKNYWSLLDFDITSTRSKRLASNKFALLSTVLNRFIENCKSNYIPNLDITVDEQLFPTEARYPFTQYMANKPDKFEVKFG